MRRSEMFRILEFLKLRQLFQFSLLGKGPSMIFFTNYRIGIGSRENLSNQPNRQPKWVCANEINMSKQHLAV